MMAGDTLFAEVALPAALSAIKEGFNIKIISGGTDGRSSFWVTRPGEAIDKPADLKGKRFVYSRPKSVSEAITLAALKSWDITAADVKMIAIGDFGAGLDGARAQQGRRRHHPRADLLPRRRRPARSTRRWAGSTRSCRPMPRRSASRPTR